MVGIRMIQDLHFLYSEIERYNVFNVAMLVRHDEDGKYYLYDIMKIKKETSILFQSNDLTQ